MTLPKGSPSRRSSPGRSRQLALDFPALARDPALTYVETASQADARAALARWRDWPGGVMALVGPTGAGKSHLATLWARASDATMLAAEALPEAEVSGAVVVEDADHALATARDQAGFERALMCLMERARAGEVGPALFTARAAPAIWRVALPDLVSRLALAPVIAIGDPDDDDLRALLTKLLADRGVEAPKSMLDYVMRRMERSFDAVQDVIVRLDRAALERKQRVSRTLAREVLGWAPEDGDGGAEGDERQKDTNA